MRDRIAHTQGDYTPTTFWERPEGVTGQIVSDRRFWRLGNYLYQSLMRKITQLFVEIDQIGIMSSYVEHLERKLADTA